MKLKQFLSIPLLFLPFSTSIYASDRALDEATYTLVDGIGDAVVVLTNLAELVGVPIEDCIQEAYNVINKRKGKMINGTFVKNN